MLAAAEITKIYKYFKVIPQNQELQMNCFETFPKCSLPSTVSENTIKMISHDHHARLRAGMDQSYPIYACARVYHARYSSVQVTNVTAFAGNIVY